MPRIVVLTDEGQPVWAHVIADERALDHAMVSMHAEGSSIVAGLRRAVIDAYRIERGLDPERPSERAMRLAALESRGEQE